jgi:DNA-binding NtrC family response regulator
MENAIFDGGGRVLIMDDQESIRRLLGKMLNLMNCECGFAENGHAAVEIYRNAMEKGRPYDLVVMDLTIPGGMGGKDTLAALLEIDPDVKAVIASGYVNDPVMANYTEYGFKGRLEKPFKVNDLKALMNRLMGS